MHELTSATRPKERAGRLHAMGRVAEPRDHLRAPIMLAALHPLGEDALSRKGSLDEDDHPLDVGYPLSMNSQALYCNFHA